MRKFMLRRRCCVAALVGLAAFGWLCFFLPSKTAAMEDTIIAVVNEEVVTLKDFQDYIRSTYVSLAAQGVPDDQLRRMMNDLQTNGINTLIEDRIILNRANAVGLDVREKLIDDRVDEIIGRYPSENDFLGALIEHGGTITQLRNKIRDQLKIQFVVDREVRSRIYVNPQEVTEFYEKNKNDFRRPESARVESLFFAAPKDLSDDSQRIAGALKMIQEGKAFEETAQISKAVFAPNVIERGQLRQNIEDKIFALKEGEVSDAVEVNDGVYFFRLKEKIPSQIAPLEDIKSAIYDRVFKEKFKKRFDAWLKKLKDKAYVEIK